MENRTLRELESPGDWTPLEKTIFSRRSTRAFKKKPLPDFMIRRILEAGRFAPSAGNAQPWRFAVIKSPEILSEMEADAVKTIKLVMFFLDYTRSRLRNIFLKPLIKFIIRLRHNELHPVPFGLMNAIAAGRAPVFHQAPTLILLFEDCRGVSSPPMDIGICGQNMVLAAHAMGASACWIGLIKLLMFHPKWKKFFNVKYPYRLNVCLAVGWPKVDSDRPVEREVQLVEWYEGNLMDGPRIERQGE